MRKNLMEMNGLEYRWYFIKRAMSRIVFQLKTERMVYREGMKMRKIARARGLVARHARRK